MDPLEFRLKNGVDEGEPAPLGDTWTSVRLKECLQTVKTASGWDRRKPPNVGRGVAICQDVAGWGGSTSVVEVGRDGSVILKTGVNDQGSGPFTILVQIVGHELQLPLALSVLQPFHKLKGGTVAARRERHVTPEETDDLLEACPSTQWRAVVGLARLAGLRVPSETHGLRWGDIDFARGRMTVRSPKTERYKGHEQRLPCGDVPPAPSLPRPARPVAEPRLPPCLRRCFAGRSWRTLSRKMPSLSLGHRRRRLENPSRTRFGIWRHGST